MLKLTRRTCLGVATGFAASATPVRLLHAADTFDDALEDIRERLIEFHRSIAFRQVEPGSLLTGNAGINGGLRYDETGRLTDTGTFVIQPSARVGDADQRDRTGVLPLFQIFGAAGGPGEDPTVAALRVVEILLDVLKLDRSRIAFITVPKFETVQPQIAESGLWRADYILFRDPEEAMAAGDGSGYFRVPGEPAESGVHTAGIYYSLDANPGAGWRSPEGEDGWIEIGELFLDADQIQGYGLGLERIAMALTGEVPTWQSWEPLLKERVESAKI